MVKLTKIKDYTLRYYENIGLIKNVKRNSSGKRLYDEKDLINGYISAQNRHGIVEKFPLVSVSIAGLTNKTREFASIYALAKESSIIKKRCKQNRIEKKEGEKYEKDLGNRFIAGVGAVFVSANRGFCSQSPGLNLVFCAGRDVYHRYR